MRDSGDDWATRLPEPRPGDEYRCPRKVNSPSGGVRADTSVSEDQDEQFDDRDMLLPVTRRGYTLRRGLTNER
jgi:hypothetical protein